ncbi:hypothetical protein DEO72_LG5g1161 [Vigna unguiculata]|uniref:Uncharacterized protein n=1 Tax=Vigna unguiculata TaxID=3917 RepID=A0A4D6LX81_VIGUN|nr:hypothetical protein DEO72_LG5g1161 [Vigna unguiculata]
MARDETLFDIVVVVARDFQRFAGSQSVWRRESQSSAPWCEERKQQEWCGGARCEEWKQRGARSGKLHGDLLRRGGWSRRGLGTARCESGKL